MEFKKIDFKEYKKIRKLLLISVETLKQEVYKDNRGIATIGIGVNIGDKTLKGLWIRLVLYYLFDLIKKAKDISFIRFDDYKYTFTNIIKDTESYKYKEYKTLIDNIADKMLQTLQTNIKTSALNAIIKNAIESYTNETNKKQQDKNPKSSLEQLQRLSKVDLKIDESDSKNPKYIEFKLSKEQTEELFDIMAINYEAIALSELNDKQIKLFNKIKDKDENQREYYKEFIPFVSIVYKGVSPIRQSKLLAKAFNEYKSRFFIWAVIRYTLGSDLRRRILQVAIFNFNGKVGKETETDKEKFHTCVDIFTGLNLLKEKKETYLEYFKKQDKLMKDAIKNEKDAFNNKNVKNKKANYLDDPHYEIYRSGYINPNELDSLQNILKPYVEFLDKSIQKATFESNEDFKSKQEKQKPRFQAENIYVITHSNYNEAIQAIYTNTTQTNILIIIAEKIDREIKIQRPNNSYLYIVTTKGNMLDCSFVNNPTKERILANDKAELYLYEEKDDSTINITSFATQELQLNEDNNKQLSADYNNFTYSFDERNCLNIKRDGMTLATLVNYYSFFKETNKNTTNKDSHSIILCTMLPKNIVCCNLGIELKTPKEQDTFSNNGNFTLYINNINLASIENQTKHSITKDSAIFCYVAESKQNFIAKLKDKQVIFHIDINRTHDKTLIDTKFIYLSFIIFQNNTQANITTSQKLQITSDDLQQGKKTIDFKLPYNYLAYCKAFEEWKRESNGEIRIVNKNGDYLFSIEKHNIKENELTIKDLYAYGIQWFETSAEKYHKLLDINPHLKDKAECEKLGLLYFTWSEIVEFSHENNGDLHWYDILFITSMSDKLNYTKNMPYDWKKSQKGARGYILVSMEGIPYWADAVGQIPYAIDVYRALYREYGNKQQAKNGTIKLGYLFASGTLMNADSSNSYDNAMILRGVKWAEKRYYKPTISDCFSEISLKNCGYKTLKITDYPISHLSKDSNGRDVFKETLSPH